MVRDVREEPASAGEVEHRGHDVFVSYSRADRELVIALTEKLSVAGKKAWVDLEDIPPSAEWMSEIRAAIGSSDGYIVVISPDLARSTICEEELRNATEAGKRIVPVMVRRTDPHTVPDSLSRLNWIDATDGDLSAACAIIIDTLDTDLEHVKAHTRLLVRAAEWREGSEDRSILLRGHELAEAERLIEDADREPRPTQLQTSFVLASRRSSGRRQRAGVAIALVVALVAGSLGVFAWSQRSAAEENERLAVRRAAVSRSRELAAAATGQLEIDPELSLMLTREALNSAATPEAVAVLRGALSASRVRATLVGHEGPVASVSFSPDGTHVLTASYDGSARVWDLADPDSALVLSDHDDLNVSASFSSDGSRVVTASFDGTARVWDVATGSDISVLVGHEGAVRDASFSPDGTTVVTGGDDGTVRLWNAESGEPRGVFRGHERPVFDASFSPDGRSVLSASDDDTARLWDARTGRIIHVLRGHEDGLYTASFSPDGDRVVTASEDGTAIVWDTGTGRSAAELTGSRGPVVSAMFSPDGRRVVTASDSDARVWDATSGDSLQVLRGHTDELNVATFDPDARYVLTASVDGTARVFDVPSGALLAVLRGHDGSVLAATFSPDGSRVLTGGEDGTARIWESVSGQVVYRGNDVSNVFTDASGTDLSISTWAGAVHVDDALTGLTLRTLRFPAPITSASFSADGRMISAAGVDGVTRIVEAGSGETLVTLRGPEPVWTGADFWGRSDQVLTWGDDGTARLWDPRSGDALHVFDHGSTDDRIVYEGHLSRDGRRVFTTGLVDGKVEMWDASSGERLWAEEGLLSSGGIGAGLSPDGSMVGVVASTTTIRDGDTGAVISSLDDPGRILGIVFSPNGRVVVTRAGDGAARTWDPETGALLTVMPGHGGTVNSAFFSADGRWIATTADDSQTRVWDSATGALVATYPNAGGPGVFAQFAADDQVVVASSADGVRIDRCEACGTLTELLQLSDLRITRSFTEAERAAFLGGSKGDAGGVLPPRRAGLVGADGEPVPDSILDPGTYTTVAFEPPVSFVVGEGWLATTYLDRAKEGESVLSQTVQLQRLDAPSNGLVILDLGLGRAIDGRKEWDERLNVSPFPADLGRWLSGHPDLRSRILEPADIDGVVGEAVETVVTSVPEENPWPVCGGCVTLLAFTLQNDTGPLTTNDAINALGPGEVDRWIVLETETGTLLINYFSASRRDFRAFEPFVDDVLASMQIGG